jgi:IS5 family transposase
MIRIAEPQLSFADLELRSQGVHLDPLLQGILGFLDDHAALVEQVRQDLARGLKNPNTGRGGITPAQTLRSLILMRVKNWDYRELRERINDGYTLAIPCAALPISTATVCPGTTPSTAPLAGSPRPPCKPSTKP